MDHHPRRFAVHSGNQQVQIARLTGTANDLRLCAANMSKDILQLRFIYNRTHEHYEQIRRGKMLTVGIEHLVIRLVPHQQVAHILLRRENVCALLVIENAPKRLGKHRLDCRHFFHVAAGLRRHANIAVEEIAANDRAANLMQLRTGAPGDHRRRAVSVDHFLIVTQILQDFLLRTSAVFHDLVPVFEIERPREGICDQRNGLIKGDQRNLDLCINSVEQRCRILVVQNRVNTQPPNHIDFRFRLHAGLPFSESFSKTVSIILYR